MLILRVSNIKSTYNNLVSHLKNEQDTAQTVNNFTICHFENQNRYVQQVFEVHIFCKNQACRQLAKKNTMRYFNPQQLDFGEFTTENSMKKAKWLEKKKKFAFSIELNNTTFDKDYVHMFLQNTYNIPGNVFQVDDGKKWDTFWVNFVCDVAKFIDMYARIEQGAQKLTSDSVICKVTKNRLFDYMVNVLHNTEFWDSYKSVYEVVAYHASSVAFEPSARGVFENVKDFYNGDDYDYFFSACLRCTHIINREQNESKWSTDIHGGSPTQLSSAGTVIAADSTSIMSDRMLDDQMISAGIIRSTEDSNNATMNKSIDENEKIVASLESVLENATAKIDDLASINLDLLTRLQLADKENALFQQTIRALRADNMSLKNENESKHNSDALYEKHIESIETMLDNLLDVGASTIMAFEERSNKSSIDEQNHAAVKYSPREGVGVPHEKCKELVALDHVELLSLFLTADLPIEKVEQNNLTGILLDSILKTGNSMTMNFLDSCLGFSRNHIIRFVVLIIQRYPVYCGKKMTDLLVGMMDTGM